MLLSRHAVARASLVPAVIVGLACALEAHATDPRPNVLLILTDDQGWGDLRLHGNDTIDTPVLDRLGRESARFDRFYVSPVCAPTRASLLTGRYHLRTGVSWVTARREVMRAEEVTLAEVFKSHGYRTGAFGKWHNGEQYPNHPNGQGFDEFFGFCGGHWPRYFDPPLEHNGRPVATYGYITDVLTDAALRFIEANRDRPFLCYVPFNAPHSPWQLPDSSFDKYKARGLGDEDASAYGMVENLDENVGRLLRKLDELGLADNTIVLFLSDNGPVTARYNGGMRGQKGSVHEGGIRVPLFVRWPGQVRPRLIEPIAAHIDLLPTLAELCGLPLPPAPAIDGVSLAPLLRGEDEGWPDRMLFAHQVSGRGQVALDHGAVRTPRHRLVRENGKYELYDIVADPAETNDLASAQPELVRRLGAAYEAWLADVRRGAEEKSPVPVGFREQTDVRLPAAEAEFSGRLRFFNLDGYAHDWLTGWSAVDDRIWWNLEVAAAGRYEVTLLFACATDCLGSRVRVSAGASSAEATIAQAFDPAPYRGPEHSLKHVGWLRDFASLHLGAIRLEPGRVPLTLEAVAIPGASVADVGAVLLRRLE